MAAAGAKNFDVGGDGEQVVVQVGGDEGTVTVAAMYLGFGGDGEQVGRQAAVVKLIRHRCGEGRWGWSHGGSVGRYVEVIRKVGIEGKQVDRQLLVEVSNGRYKWQVG